MNKCCSACGEPVTTTACPSCETRPTANETSSNIHGRANADAVAPARPWPRLLAYLTAPRSISPQTARRWRNAAILLVVALATVSALAVVGSALLGDDKTQIATVDETQDEPKHDVRQFEGSIVLPGMPVVPDYYSALQQLEMYDEQMEALLDPEKELDCSEGTDEQPLTLGTTVDVLQGGALIDSARLGKGVWRSTTGCRFEITYRADALGAPPVFTLPDGQQVAIEQ